MHGLILASVPSNTEAGSYMTFGGPVGLFCIVITILWLLFSRPHRRVPPRGVAMATASAPAPPAETATAPDAGKTTTGSVSGEVGGTASAEVGDAETGTSEGTEATE